MTGVDRGKSAERGFTVTSEMSAKRFRWYSREDYEMLKALEPEARRDMEAFIKRQEYEQRNHDRLFSATEPTEVELVGGAHRARAVFGTGGGRTRRLSDEPE